LEKGFLGSSTNTMAATTTTASPLLLQSSSWATACKRSTHHGILSFINSSSQETAAVKLSPMHTSPLRISRKGKTLHYGSHGRFSCHRAVVSAEYRFAYNCLSIYLSSLLDLSLGLIPHMYTSLCLQVLQGMSGCYLKIGYKMYT
jgi:hypothetical protein